MRMARAARVQGASRRQGVIYHLPGPAAVLRNMALRALPQEAVAARFDWLYTYRGQ
jgi:salicylate hydroxylase